MPSSYPSSAKSFTAKIDNVDTVAAGDVNALQDEVSAVEAGLLGGLAHDLIPDADNTRSLGSAAKRWKTVYGQQLNLAAQPHCVAFHSTFQALTSGVATVLSLDSETVDVGALHDLVTLNSHVTVPALGDGFYVARGRVSLQANATGYRQVTIRKNGVTSLAIVAVAPVNSGSVGTVCEVSWYGALVAGDYLELLAFQNSGGALNTDDSSIHSELAVVKLY